VTGRTQEAKQLAALQVEEAAAAAQQKAVEADLRPVKFLATIVRSSNEATMRYFSLVVAPLLDPAAVSLLMAATSRKLTL
jgi:hypothetical protein